jgi:bifunctional non-homologous end joining protein LigD
MPRTNGELGFIEPQLATLVDQPPVGEDWIHEVKHDGYRTLLVTSGR